MQRLLLVLLLLAAPFGQAAFNDPLPYSATSAYSESMDAITALLSGAVQYEGSDARDASLLLGTDGFTVSGLQRVCWEDANGNNRCRDGDGLSVQLQSGGSVAFRTPETYNVSMDADHALAFFADAGQMFGADHDEQIAFGQSIVAFPTGEEIHISDLAPIPTPPRSSYSSFNDAIDDLALLFTLSGTSTLTLHDGSDTFETLSGNGQWVGFQGMPEFTTIHANVVALPMPDGATATFIRSPEEAAQEGLQLDNLKGALGSIETSEGASDDGSLGPIEQASTQLAGFLNGALLGFAEGGMNEADGAAGLLNSITVVRFEEMQATRDGDTVVYEGAAPLQIQGGDVVGAQPLIGIAPLSAFIFWAIAIILFVVCLVLKPAKHNKFWDNFQWVGWVAGAVAVIIVFFMWDRAMVQLYGTSLLSGGATGTTLGVIAALQLVPLLLAGLFFGLPTRIITTSVTRLAGQGRMMRIGNVIAPFVTFLMGLPLMLALLALILDMVASSGS